MMKRAKMVGVAGLGLLGGGIAVAGAGLVGDSPRLFGLGVLVALAGLTTLWGVQLWILRLQMRMLRKGSPEPGDRSVEQLVKAMRPELDEIVQTIDARVLGLIELLDRGGMPSEGAGGSWLDGEPG